MANHSGLPDQFVSLFEVVNGTTFYLRSEAIPTPLALNRLILKRLFSVQRNRERVKPPSGFDLPDRQPIPFAHILFLFPFLSASESCTFATFKR
ncbi:hypothetical protein HDF14_003591 [Edaphobacter lichenicola]|uniref:Uncharacterized protein n=1 Tax=Tunturiibacter gelidiferens TaxID=3069689 RepID=A0A9X0U6M2_9BACT|nr:hypothetical protein [Edaphobacter lichenicola]